MSSPMSDHRIQSIQSFNSLFVCLFFFFQKSKITNRIENDFESIRFNSTPPPSLLDWNFEPIRRFFSTHFVVSSKTDARFAVFLFCSLQRILQNWQVQPQRKTEDRKQTTITAMLCLFKTKIRQATKTAATTTTCPMF